MQSQRRSCCDWIDLHNDLNDLGFQTNVDPTDFITVHTFGGRGSPSF